MILNKFNRDLLEADKSPLNPEDHAAITAIFNGIETILNNPDEDK